MNPDFDIEVPGEWHALLQTEPRGTIMVMGGPDTGKSTLVRWLIQRLAQEKCRPAWIDCDVGQSTLGMPATVNMALVEAPISRPPTAIQTFFVGSISPRRHMLPLIVGAERLRRNALRSGADCLVTDTTGMISAETGGGALKQWKIELLQPDRIIGLEHQRELDPILMPLENAAGTKVHRMKPAGAVRTRRRQTREEHRRQRYRRYFTATAAQRLSLRDLPVYNKNWAQKNALLSLQDATGFSLALGIALKLENEALEVRTPLSNFTEVASLRFGSLSIEPGSWREERINR